ncbi:hypothetical protein ACOMHN_045767 [Nucella lapillus]
MASKVQLDLNSKHKASIGEFNGMVMLELFEPVADHLRKIRAMEIRDDDVLLCSYPKSGTHWLFRVIDMLQRGQALYDKRKADCTFLDLQRIERMVELDSPRQLVTHVPFDLLPQQVKDKRTKIVHVYRNPRAVLVSLHCQLTSLEEDKEQWAVDKMVDLMFAGKLPYYGWFNYMTSVQAYQKENPHHPFFHLSYEEMIKNPLATVTSLAEFLDKTGPPQLYADIVEACSFKKQKASEEEGHPDEEAKKFYRKGDMNDWKNYLTVAMDERFDQELRKRTGFPFGKY